MPAPVYSQPETVVPLGSDMGPTAFGPAAASPSAAAASSLVMSEQASLGAADFGTVADVIKVTAMAIPTERTDRDMAPPREFAPNCIRLRSPSNVSKRGKAHDARALLVRLQVLTRSRLIHRRPTHSRPHDLNVLNLVGGHGVRIV